MRYTQKQLEGFRRASAKLKARAEADRPWREMLKQALDERKDHSQWARNQVWYLLR